MFHPNASKPHTSKHILGRRKIPFRYLIIYNGYEVDVITRLPVPEDATATKVPLP